MTGKPASTAAESHADGAGEARLPAPATAELRVPDPVAIARAFHDTYERLAPSFGYETRRESAVPWDDVPAPNRLLMCAVVDCLIAEGLIR